MNYQETYTNYTKHLQKIADVDHAISVLNWDQEVYLPQKSGGLRAQQIATLSGIMHELKVAPQLGEWLTKLDSANGSLNSEQHRNVAESLKEYKKKQGYSKDFVIALANATAKAFQAWRKAKESNDFSIYQEPLSAMVQLKREEAEIIGYSEHPYDALLDEYEPGEKTSNLSVLFADVRAQLVDFVKEIAERPQVDFSCMYAHYNKNKQWNFGLELLQQMGYDFNTGRQDIAPHPFTTSFGPSDVRVTTRISENDLDEMIWSCIHEGGHALYEQGLKVENYGLPTGKYISLGIHESQSRLWENNVGRGLPYWQANYPRLQSLFPESLGNTSLDTFYKAMNAVRPSLIRTNADELTYHFHILVRFEIEKALIEGSIEVKDLPEMWNQKYKEYVGIDVPSDQKGVLQDIHWSHGSFGYFPTYSMGSFYAAQFYAQAKKEIPTLESDIAAGNMLTLLTWLREKVHQHGRLYSAEDLCINITGEKLNFKYFMDYAREKYGYIYGVR